MRSGNSFWNGKLVNAALLTLFTLVGWVTAAFLFVLLKRAPLTRGAPIFTYPVVLGSLLPWLSGCVSWIRVRKIAKLGAADGDTAGLCHSIIFSALCTAYVPMVSIGILLLWVLTRAG
jgi:hypothetical protein